MKEIGAAAEIEDDEGAAGAEPCGLQTTPSVKVANVRCETCQFIANNREKILLRSITVVFLLLELILAIACFSIEMSFDLCSYYLRYYVQHPSEKRVHLMVAYTRLTYVTIGAVAIIFVPLILLSLIFTRKFCVFSFMSFLLGVVGFGTFLAVSIVAFVQADLPGANAADFQEFAGCALALSIVFLIHVVYEVWKYLFKTHRYAD